MGFTKFEGNRWLIWEYIYYCYTAQSGEEVFRSFEESENKHDGHGEICCLKTSNWYAALGSIEFSVQTEWPPASALHEIKCMHHHKWLIYKMIDRSSTKSNILTIPQTSFP